MQLHFWGAAGTVTGSMHVVEVGGYRVMLDCGLYQGRRKKAFQINRELPFEAATIDAVILSHAHIDHSGNLPSLVRSGFTGPIFCTSATRDLAARMLLDSAKIQAYDLKYVNRHRQRVGKRPFEPLYTTHDVHETVSQFVPIDYQHGFEPVANVRCEFYDAGHMLGSAGVAVDVRKNGSRRRLVFSGDIGNTGTPILREPRSIEGADLVIMESTYGDKVHESSRRTKEMLKESIAQCEASGGKLIIPAFSVGRTQEIVYRLNELFEAGELPPIPIFVDSPLAVDVTDIYRVHPECFDAETVDALEDDDDNDPFGFHRLRYCRSVKESKALNKSTEAAVIISASGMCEGGRILHHLRNHLDEPTTQVLFAGYQAPNTLGRKLLDGVNPVPIYGQKIEVRAQIGKIEGCSAHADRPGLLHWMGETQRRGSVEQVFLVHGEAEPAQALAEGLVEQNVPQVAIPQRGESFDV
ncbi:MAG: MBL fold metallo-hydrolase [Planctomycetota bacterium]|nr:MAG: MBL fold metallo-hydrolase [Planctomycetota bacterium]REJ95149.1 MAG: MBL fold metallo-hydrolase [Planctomycetota bacterium]REK30293.1 MAG: MBL fold metallo-hydrolase [Planctomycetota bacterium]REK49282.1 MAG: MBL fold metallo-hydrolase [Planctomycetota bacterium]